MLNTRFGIEIELTGLTRSYAAKVIAEMTGGTKRYIGDHYDTFEVEMPDGRSWKFMSDSSIRTQKKENGRIVSASSLYACEVVSPILTYAEDMELLQNIVRTLRHNGAIANSSAGIHIHLDGAGHDARTIKNWINLIYSKNDLLYKALDIKPDRMHFCKAMDAGLVEKIRTRKPKTLDEIEDIWYEGNHADSGRHAHYNESRYHCLNLHAAFTKGTIEFRLFQFANPSEGRRGGIHGGEIKSYIQLCLALSQAAKELRSASPKEPQRENPKFAMRTWLMRLGFIGEEFATAREILTRNLAGDAAFRFGRSTPSA